MEEDNLYSYVQPQLSVNVLWQDSSTSWQATSPADYSELAKQFLSLMGNDPDSPWTLVLDITGPYRRTETGAWNPEKLGDFLQALDRLGLAPTLGYHPKAPDSLYDWVGNMDKYSPKSPEQSMAQDIKGFNDYIEQLDSDLPRFELFVTERQTGSRDDILFPFLSIGLELQRLDLEKSVRLWSTSNYAQGVGVSGPYQPNSGVIDAGLFAQIYNFYNKPGAPADQQNPYVNTDTDPADAATLGQGIFRALQFPDNAHMHPELVKYAERGVHVFNFGGHQAVGSGTGSVAGAPVFGGAGQSGVADPGWDLDSFNTVMQGYASAYLDANGVYAPTIGIWGAENALNVLAPRASLVSTETLEKLAAVFSTGGAGAEERGVFNKYEHNVVLVPESDSIELTVGFSAAYRNGVGLYPLLDPTGRLVSVDGEILHPDDAGYLEAALDLAQSLGLWQADSRPGQDSAYHAQTWVASVEPGVSYAVLGASDLSGDTVLYSSLSAANPDGEVHFAGAHGDAARRIGFEDLPNGGDNDYNDVTLTITDGVGTEGGGTDEGGEASTRFVTESVFDVSRYAAQTTAPELDSVWMDGTALDKGTAYQLAELITGHLGNHDLDLVMDVSPPNNLLLNPTPKSHQAAGFPKIQAGFEQYKDFLDNIDLYVDKLSDGGASWDGELIYHPQTEVSEFDSSVVIKGKTVKTGWAGFEAPVPSDPSKTFTLTSDQSKDYEAYIDWMGAFNDYMTVHGQKTFSEFLFEPEASNWQGRLDELFGPDTARAYQGNPDLFASSEPPLQSDIPFTVTSSALANWDSDYSRGGWGADGNWAQIYDLMNDPEYKPEWPKANGQAQLDPADYTPQEAAEMFIDFFVNPEAGLNPSGNPDPRADIYNINRLVTPQANSVSPATEFDARSHLIFSYGPDQGDGPVFKNADGTNPPWEWSKEDFGQMVAALREGLPPALDKVSLGKGKFAQTTEDLNIGVWGSDRALDAWFGIPDPGQLDMIA